MNVRQVRDILIVPCNVALGLNSPSATALLLGTAAVESQMGKYIRQLKGPAIGLFQMEPFTFNDIWARKIDTSVALKARIRLLLGYEVKPPAERMASDLILATVMTRLFYYAIPEPLPDKDDIIGLGNYWKSHYNSANGKGSVEEFTDAYTKLVVKGL